MSVLQPGQTAPEFALPAAYDHKVSLSEFRGGNLILIFYPADWSPVCSDELSVFNEILPMLKEFNAQILGISVDGPWCHQAFRQARNIKFPLLSDFEPKGEVARKYGSYREGEGTSERSLYVIDGEGIIRWSYLSPLGVNPGADGVLDALESLSHAEVSR
ncbi:MAG: redoxin domain-containing protein [Fibrobacteres bacterium]|nr:redoxin domain-containing protein [Fibrobacterota bacterium]